MSHQRTISAAFLVVLALSLGACSKQDDQAAGTAFPTGNGDKPLTLAQCDAIPDPKPADDSAAGRSTAVSLGLSARSACRKAVSMQADKPNADLARIREIKEKEEAERTSSKISEEEWKRRIKEGSSAPLKEYKY